MSKLILDYDPLSGTSEYLEMSEGGDKMRVVQAQDVTSILESAKAMALDEDYTKHGVKQDQWHYARIPDVIMMEMKRKYGVDWLDKNDKGHKKFLRVLNRHYPAFKTTAWNHE